METTSQALIDSFQAFGRRPAANSLQRSVHSRLNDSQDSICILNYTKPIHLLMLCITIFNKSNGSLSFIYFYVIKIVGRDSSVGIATCYGQDGAGIETRWGWARFSAPVHKGPGANPASYIVGTESFQEVKWPRRGVDLPPPPIAEVKERVEVYIYSHCGSQCSFTR